MPAASDPRAAYLHVPFCRHRCGYCNFTVVAGRDELIPAYLQALEKELSSLGVPREVDTLFVGGGTPTHLRPEELSKLLEIARRWFPLAPGYEFSVEANPADLNRQRLEVLAEGGVNRLSLGVQSFHAATLGVLERDHRQDQILSVWELARPRFPSLSLDLIFGCPGQSQGLWQADLEAALALHPDHVSAYGLTYERGTSFWARRMRGELVAAGEELERALFELAIDRLTAAGLAHYEVSNFARAGHTCRHNETYWAAGEYYAAGPGAARYVAGRRETNHRSTTTWLKRVLAGQSPVAEAEELPPEDRAREALVLGLRRMAGIDLAEFADRFGYDVATLAGEALDTFITLGLVERAGERIRLTRAGLLVSDSLWGRILRR